MDNFTIKTLDGAEQKAALCGRILRGLTSWFGIEESIADYVEQSKSLPLITAVIAEGEPIGFLAVKVHTPYAAEICVMGVLKEYHRMGIGRALVESCEGFCRENAVEFLTVKTLDGSAKSKSYEKTRSFYAAMGFRPLEVFPTLWDAANPCLLMAKYLGGICCHKTESII